MDAETREWFQKMNRALDGVSNRLDKQLKTNSDAFDRLSNRLEQQIGKQSVLQNSLFSSLDQQLKAQSDTLGRIDQQLGCIENSVDSVKNEVRNPDHRFERQEQRLVAIEGSGSSLSFRQPRTYGTEVHSVSLPPHRRTALASPKFGRVRLGYAG